MKPKKMKVTCHACKKPISGARTIIEGRYHCGPCTYKHDHPDADPQPITRPRAKPQEERLFPLPPPKEDRG